MSLFQEVEWKLNEKPLLLCSKCEYQDLLATPFSLPHLSLLIPGLPDVDTSCIDVNKDLLINDNISEVE
jgi:hypothetical protein